MSATAKGTWERRSLQDEGSQHSYATFEFKYLWWVFLWMSTLIHLPATSKICHVARLKLKLDCSKCDPDNGYMHFIHCNVTDHIREIFLKSKQEDLVMFISLHSRTLSSPWWWQHCYFEFIYTWDDSTMKEKEIMKMQLIIAFEVLEQRLVLSQDFTVRDFTSLKFQGSGTGTNILLLKGSNLVLSSIIFSLISVFYIHIWECFLSASLTVTRVDCYTFLQAIGVIRIWDSTEGPLYVF